MKKATLFILAAFLLISSIVVPAYSAIITKPVIIMGDGDPIPLPPPPR